MNFKEILSPRVAAARPRYFIKPNRSAGGLLPTENVKISSENPPECCSPDLYSISVLPPTAATDWLTNCHRGKRQKYDASRESNNGISTPQIPAGRRHCAQPAATDRYEELEQTETGAPSVRSRRMQGKGVRTQTPAGMWVMLRVHIWSEFRIKKDAFVSSIPTPIWVCPTHPVFTEMTMHKTHNIQFRKDLLLSVFLNFV